MSTLAEMGRGNSFQGRATYDNGRAHLQNYSEVHKSSFDRLQNRSISNMQRLSGHGSEMQVQRAVSNDSRLRSNKSNLFVNADEAPNDNILRLNSHRSAVKSEKSSALEMANSMINFIKTG